MNEKAKSYRVMEPELGDGLLDALRRPADEATLYQAAYDAAVEIERLSALPPMREREEIAWAFDQACCDAIKDWLREEAPIGARETVHSGHIFWLMTRLKAALSLPAGQEWRDISSAPKGGSLAEKLRRRADEHEAKGDRKSKTIADELRAWAEEDVAK